MRQRSRCEAVTKAGDRCKNHTRYDTGYCYAHRALATQEHPDPEANPLSRLRSWWQGLLNRYWPLAALLGLITLILSLAQLYNSLTGIPLLEIVDRSTPRMAGDFRIAVAGFAEEGCVSDCQNGIDWAKSVRMHLGKLFEDMDLDYTVMIWGPDEVGAIHGQSDTERARAAAELAESIGSDIVVYGWVETVDAFWRITPEFYVSLDNFYEAEEITGQHCLGTPFSVLRRDETATRFQVSSEFRSRASALAHLCSGLAYYSFRDFEQALEEFEIADQVEDWEEDEGKQILYLLLGNAAMKTHDLQLAERYYKHSLDLDVQYSRAHAGIAAIQYLSALKTFETTKDRHDIDADLVRKAIESYKRARGARNQPPLSDILVKVHFGLGQCYLVQVYGGSERVFDLAIAEFRAVIEAHGDGVHTRLRVLAAESHAALGLIYELSGQLDQGIEEYKAAASLLFDDLERQQFFKEQAHQLEQEGR